MLAKKHLAGWFLVVVLVPLTYAQYDKSFAAGPRKLRAEPNPNGPHSFKRLLQYFRSQGLGPAVGAASVETDSHESRANLNQARPHRYRIDLSRPRSDGSDEMPYAEEMVPVASYTYDDPGHKTKNLTQETAEVSPGSSGDATVPVTIVHIVSIPENKPNITTIENMNGTKAEAVAVTVLPIEPTSASSIEKLLKSSMDEDDLVVPPVKEDDDEVEEDDDEDSAEDEQCAEGKTKKQKCNTCVCVDGAFFCSKKKCGPPAPATQLGEQKHEEMMEKVATKKVWNGRKKLQSTTPLPDCTSGMSKRIDCNQCICAMGKWACTKRSCIALSLREKASYTDGSIVKTVDTLTENHDLDEDCGEGNTRQLDCNQCVCHYNSWSCTQLPCAPTPAPPKPVEIEEACQKEGDVKTRDCNLCKCKRGVWVCTTNNCKLIGDRLATPPLFRTSSKISKD